MLLVVVLCWFFVGLLCLAWWLLCFVSVALVFVWFSYYEMLIVCLYVLGWVLDLVVCELIVYVCCLCLCGFWWVVYIVFELVWVVGGFLLVVT